MKAPVQTISCDRVEYKTSIDFSSDLASLAVFVKPNLRNHIEFDKEHWKMITEFPLTLLWDMLRDNLVNAQFPEDAIGLLRRQKEALAAEKFLEGYEKE